jgi:opacity protein-like surface antigen
MKKVILGIALIISINFSLFAQVETWNSYGFNFGNYFEHGDDLGDIYIGSPGINVNSYIFLDKKMFGFFYNIGLFFPVTENVYTPIIQADFVLGPSFRYDINEKLKLHLGIGVDINLLLLKNGENTGGKHDITEANAFNIGLGIGWDIGLKYDITDTIYINFGTTMPVIGKVIVNINHENQTNWNYFENGYSMVVHYIAIGFNYNQERGQWGKPK